MKAIKQLTQLGAGGMAIAAQSMENATLNNFYKSQEGQEKIQEFYRKSLERNK